LRILLGTLRGLAFLTFATQLASGCDQIPAGYTLWIRLAEQVSTYTAKAGDPVHAVLLQDVVCGNEVIAPMGTPVEGVVRAKHKVGWGMRYETALLELEFTEIKVAPDSAIQISARVEEVENAREHVKNGVIHGVMSNDTFQGRVNSRLIHMPTWNPYSDFGLIVYKATFPIFPEPEIYYPAGTDMRVKTTAAVQSLPTTPKTSEPDIANLDLLADWVQQVPYRSTTQKSVEADLVNIVFLGSAEQVHAAFQRAGWQESDPVSRHSVMKNLYALLNNSAYSNQPMMTFLLDGKPQVIAWQQTLNSYGRRDHLRMWGWTPAGATEPLWIASSTHDTGAVLSVKYKGFVHHIAPDIDDERSTVIRDLNFAGCIESVKYVPRPGIATITQNATGDLVRTDGSVAVIQLRECQPVVPDLAASQAIKDYKPGNKAFRYIRREILTFRSDIWRANIIYGAYDLTRRTVLALRRQAGPPLVDGSTPVAAVLPSASASHSD